MHLSNFGLIINYMETGGKRQWNADNVAGTGQCKVVHGRETKAVSVCAVWNLTDTAERTLWSMADSSGKVAAKAGGKTVRAGVPAVRTDIAGFRARRGKGHSPSQWEVTV